MYKLYGNDGSEKIVYTNTDKREHIESGFYSEKEPVKVPGTEIEKEPVKVPVEEKKDRVEEARKVNSKPRRKGM